MTRRTPAQYDWDLALFNDRRLSKHFTSPRRAKISHVTLHHMTIVSSGSDAGNAGALEGCYDTWQNRKASANYGVAGDQVWQFVSDNDAPWSDANGPSNQSTLSIEHANSTAGPKWVVAAETMETGQRLVATLHRLYGLGRPSRKTVKVHQDFLATACPGPYMMARLDAYIAAAAKFYDAGANPVPPPDPTPVPDPDPTPEIPPVDPPPVEPPPVDPPPVDNTTTLTIAYWNVGPLPYSNLNAADKTHIRKIIDKLKAARCSVAVLLELHEENGDNGALGYFKSIMPADWTVFEGDGGNHCVNLGNKDELLERRNYNSRGRAFTMWNLRRKSTGLAYWVNALHTKAGMTPTNIYDRNTQVKDFVAKTGHIARGISCIDKNNASAKVPGGPTKRLKDAGIVSMYDAGVPVPGSEYNSHHDVKSGKRVKNGLHIDFLGAHRLVRITKARQIQTDDVGENDHDLLLATVVIEGMK